MKTNVPLHWLPRKLALQRLATWFVLCFEQFWIHTLYFRTLAAAFLALLFFGVFNLLPPFWHHIILGAFFLSALLSLYRLKYFSFPRGKHINQRLEEINNLNFQPLYSYQDKRASSDDDAIATALWEENKRRLAKQLKNLKIGFPNPSISHIDPHALRIPIFLLFFLSLFYLSQKTSFEWAALWAPKASQAENVLATHLELWVTPPPYTHRPAIYLTHLSGKGSISVPEGSVVAVEAGQKNLKITLQGKNLKPQSSSSEAKGALFISHYRLIENCTLIISQIHHRQSWQFKVEKAPSPQIALSDTLPTPVGNGVLRLKYTVEDKYGVAKAWATFQPVHKPHAFQTENKQFSSELYAPLQLNLTLPSHGTKTAEITKNVFIHPYAGKEVALTLYAKNKIGKIGKSKTYYFILPKYIFSNPLSQALMEQRNLLASDTSSYYRVTDMLDALLLYPEKRLKNIPLFLSLKGAQTRLFLASNDEELREACNYLWTIAWHLQEKLQNAKQRLEQAEEDLKEAINRHANPQEIHQLMQNLYQAMQNYLAELRKSPASGTNKKNSNKHMKYLSQAETQQLLQQLEQKAQNGDTAAAQQLLSLFKQIMENTHNGARSGEGGQGSNAGEQQSMQQNSTQKQLQSLLQQQEDVLNKSYQYQTDAGMSSKSPQELQKQLDDLQQKQHALNAKLNELAKSLNGQQQTLQSLKEAQKAMQQAAEDLDQGNTAHGQKAQQEALKNLSTLAKQLNTPHKDTDPLGRGIGQENEKVDLPARKKQEALEILKAIQQLLSHPHLPEIERNYLNKLLDFSN